MRRILFVSILLVCALAPAVAHAGYRDVIRDCVKNNGQVKGHYSQAEYSQALRNIPTDVDEYTDCRDGIARAQARDAHRNAGGGTPADGSSFGGVGGGTGGGSGGGFGGTVSDDPTPANPSESSALDSAHKAGGGAVDVGGAGGRITPGRTGISASGFRHSLPGPVLVLLILAGLGALLAGALLFRDRLPVLRDQVVALRSRVLTRRQA